MSKVSRREFIATSVTSGAAVGAATSVAAQSSSSAVTVKVPIHFHEVSNGVARISSSNLATALVQAPEATQELLRQRGGTLAPSEIYIDNTGRVVITNQDFVEELESELDEINTNEGVLVRGNGTCGALC